MNTSGKTEWIDAEQWHDQWIGAKYVHIAKHVLVFTFGWFYDQKFSTNLLGFVYQFINRLALSTTCRTRNKYVLSQTFHVKFDTILGIRLSQIKMQPKDTSRFIRLSLLRITSFAKETCSTTGKPGTDL